MGDKVISGIMFTVILTTLLAQNIYSQDSNTVKPDSLSYSTGISDLSEYDLTAECNVIVARKNSITAYSFEDVKLGMTNDTTMLLYKDGFGNRIFDSGRIKKITFKNHSFWAGAGYGFAASVVVWGLLGLATYQGGGHPDFGRGFGFAVGVILGLPTGLLAGVISEFVTTDDVYTFPGNNTNAKIKKLKYVLKKHRK